MIACTWYSESVQARCYFTATGKRVIANRNIDPICHCRLSAAACGIRQALVFPLGSRLAAY